jgi:hypothetical protein
LAAIDKVAAGRIGNQTITTLAIGGGREDAIRVCIFCLKVFKFDSGMLFEGWR